MPRQWSDLITGRLYQELDQWPTREQLEQTPLIDAPPSRVSQKAIRDHVDEMSGFLQKYDEHAAQIEDNADLTDAAKAARLRDLADTTLAKLPALKSREAAERALRNIELLNKAMRPKRAADPVESGLQAEARDRIAGAPDAKRFGLARSHLDDPTVSVALLTAPPLLSGLTQQELEMLRLEYEARNYPEEIAERDRLTKALDTCAKAAARAQTWVKERVVRRPQLRPPTQRPGLMPAGLPHTPSQAC
jgi:hypothetical protein